MTESIPYYYISHNFFFLSAYVQSTLRTEMVNIKEDDSGRPLEEVHGGNREIQSLRALPRDVGDETATWTKTMATGFLDSLLDFDPSFWGFFKDLFSNLALSRSGSRPLRIDALQERDGLSSASAITFIRFVS
jgi:hypothetical protein